MTAPGRIETALFAVGLTMAGLVLLALIWSGADAYIDMARSQRVAGAIFYDHSTRTNSVDLALDDLVHQHNGWAQYVTGGREDPPELGTLYTADEAAHMRDVRRVFDGVKILIPAGLFVMALRLQRSRARGLETMLRLARDGAVAAGAAVAAVGILSALAFDQAFLLFHQLFFPQGNFLFDPATSNLVRLYPYWYWQGITLRIGLSFIAACAVLAIVTSMGLRRGRSTRLASA